MTRVDTRPAGLRLVVVEVLEEEGAGQGADPGVVYEFGASIRREVITRNLVVDTDSDTRLTNNVAHFRRRARRTNGKLTAIPEVPDRRRVRRAIWSGGG